MHYVLTFYENLIKESWHENIFKKLKTKKYPNAKILVNILWCIEFHKHRIDRGTNIWNIELQKFEV